MRISLQPAFILHHRPYRETSILLDLLTLEYGRIALIAKGVRSNRSPLRSILRPFMPLLLSWQGNSELMLLLSAEANGAPLQLRGNCLLSGFYLNELLFRILQKNDPHSELYQIYQHTLSELQTAELQQKTLRLFEKKLLKELGYALQLKDDFETAQPLVAEKYYQYFPERGFKECKNSSAPNFRGQHLIALDQEQLDTPESLLDAKRLMRLALAPIIGLQPLHSRKLFDKM